MIDQLKAIMGGQAQAGAIVINMAKDKKGHNLFMMNDVMNMYHTVYHENFCAIGASCHVYKQWLPFCSSKVKVCVDGPWGVPQRTHIVEEGNLYTYNGEGFNMMGSVDQWKAALKSRRRLQTRKL